MRKLLLLPSALLLWQCNGTQRHQALPPQEHAKPVAEASDSHSGMVQESRQSPISQGIKGQVLWQAGNQMPSPDAPASTGKKGVQRTLYIYKLTNASQTTSTDGVFYTGIQTNLVTQVVTDAKGNFAVNLAPGQYSLFSKEEQGLYANLFDGKMNIFPVEVQKGQVTTIEFLINYKANY